MNKDEMIKEIRDELIHAIQRIIKGTTKGWFLPFNDMAKALYEAGYRKVGDEMMSAEEVSLALYSANQYFKNEAKNIWRSEEQRIKQETAREILTTIYNRLRCATFQQTVALRIVKDLANELGVELED